MLGSKEQMRTWPQWWCCMNIIWKVMFLELPGEALCSPHSQCKVKLLNATDRRSLLERGVG